MNSGHSGKLVLQEVPSGEIEKKVVMLLSKFAKNASPELLTAKVRNTPYTLSKDIPAEKALIILEALQKLGATAAFVPHSLLQPSDEEITVVEPEPRHPFASPPPAEVEPLPSPPETKKSRSRRLVSILILILFLLSMGYLAYQLWPAFGDKVNALVSYLKQLF